MTHPPPPPLTDLPPSQGRRRLSRVLDRNMRALLEKRAAEERARGFDERLAATITRFAGSMRSVYLHAVVFAAWILVNTGLLPVVRPFDESLVVLAMVASVEAIFLSTFVLITQNRMAVLADQRADLDLHVGLLAEHELARVVGLVAQIAARMGIEEAHDPELSELARDVRPEVVLERLRQHTASVARETGTMLDAE